MNILYKSGASERSLTITDDGHITRIDLSSWDNSKVCDYLKKVFNWRNSGMIGYLPTPPT